MFALYETNNKKQGRPEGWWLGCLWRNLVTPFTLRISHHQCSPLGTRNWCPTRPFQLLHNWLPVFQTTIFTSIGFTLLAKDKRWELPGREPCRIQFLVPMLVSQVLAWGSANEGFVSSCWLNAIIAFPELMPVLGLGSVFSCMVVYRISVHCYCFIAHFAVATIQGRPLSSEVFTWIGDKISHPEALQSTWSCHEHWQHKAKRYTIVSRIYAPSFATLALVESVSGAYMRDLTFYLENTPPIPGPRLDVDIGTDR